MGKFWCWLFGHNWHEFMGDNIEKTFIFFCSRCGQTGGNVTRPAAGAEQEQG